MKMSDTILLSGSSVPLINGNSNIDYNGASNKKENVSINQNNLEQTYDSLFPALPETNNFIKVNNNSLWTNNNFLSAKSLDSANNGHAQKILKVRSSKVTETFTISCQEKRDIHRICADIAKKTDTEVEMTNNNSGSTFLIAGKYENVQIAKKRITSDLQKPISYDLNVPKECYKFILGKSGSKLKELEQKTGARIMIPKGELSEPIKIKGSKDAINAAVNEIQSISNDVLSKCKDVIFIERDFHPFINGPYNETISKIQLKTGAKITIPPFISNKNEIYIMGDQNAIQEAKEEIMKIYREKKSNCEAISIVIKKSQHKYIFGQKGSVLQEIFKTTGVSVVMPTDPESEQIILRGEQGKLGQALTFLYEKAHSEIEIFIEVKDWIQRHLFGVKGSNLHELQANFPNVRFSLNYTENLIKLNGSKKEVEKAEEVIKQQIDLITKKFKIKELEINPAYHRYIIGKGGINIKKIQEETGAKLHIPDENYSNQNIVTIEGNDETIEKATQELDLIIKKAMKKEGEVTKKLAIEQRFYSQLIGSKGENIKEIRERFNVVIAFPEPSIKSDKVTIRGEKNAVDNCFKYLSLLHQQLINDNFRLELPVNKKLLVHIIGKDATNIKKICIENDVKIDFPDEKSTSNIIKIFGKKDNVLKAKDSIQTIEKEELNLVQVIIIIPNKFHQSITGKNNRFIRSIMEECDNVNIMFPPEGSNSDKVTIRGSKEGVNKAKKILIDLSNDKQINNYEKNVICKREFHKFVIGKNGINIKKIKEPYGVTVIFPTEEEDEYRDSITIIGKKENVLNAKKKLEEMISNLEKTVEIKINVPKKYHYKFISHKEAFSKQISQENNGVKIFFPDKNATNNSDVVILKGNKESVESTKEQIYKIVEIMEQYKTCEIDIDPKYHGYVMGPYRINVKNIEIQNNVSIKFPARKNTNNEIENESEDRKKIRISGRKEDCEKAIQDLLDLVPIEVEIDVPFEYHKNLIGKRGLFLRKLQENYKVNVQIPKMELQSNKVTLTGLKKCTDQAEKIICNLIKELDEMKLDEVARSYTNKIIVQKEFIPKIIGKKGSTILELKKKYNVIITFENFALPNRKNKINESSENESVDQENESNNKELKNSNIDVIVIKGYEKNVRSAVKKIKKLIKSFESMAKIQLEIDPENYSQLIGSKGRTIKSLISKYNVKIRILNDDSKFVVISSNKLKNCEDCKEKILEMIQSYGDNIKVSQPEEHLFNEVEIKPAKNKNLNNNNTGFFVRDAPWEKQKTSSSCTPSHDIKPDTNDVEEFPSMNKSCNGSNKNDNNIAWGPKAN